MFLKNFDNYSSIVGECEINNSASINSLRKFWRNICAEFECKKFINKIGDKGLEV